MQKTTKGLTAGMLALLLVGLGGCSGNRREYSTGHPADAAPINGSEAAGPIASR